MECFIGVHFFFVFFALRYLLLRYDCAPTTPEVKRLRKMLHPYRSVCRRPPEESWPRARRKGPLP